MIHNTPTASYEEEILALSKRPEGVKQRDCRAARPYFNNFAARGKIFSTKERLGQVPKVYFDTQERADAWYKANPPKRKPAPKVKKEHAYPVKFASVQPMPGGPARQPGEPIITANTKITIAPPPPAVMYHSNTHRQSA